MRTETALSFVLKF